MKKIIYAIAALAIALTSCSKEYNEVYSPGDKLVIRAQVNDTYTKVAADNAGTFTWQAGDAITILNTDGTAFNFSTVNAGTDAAFTCPTFEGSLSTEAFYPASTNHKSGKFYLEPEFTWAQDASFMPMIGTLNTSEKKVSFKTAGAVIKLVCYNVADNARKLVVTSDTKKLSGEFTPSGSPAEIVTAAKGASDNTITINFAAGHPTTMVFYIPVPTGDLGKLSFVVKDGSDAAVSNVQETKGSITMERKHIVAAPALNCGNVPADAELTNEEILGSSIKGSYSTGSITSASGTWNYSACTQSYSAISKTYIQIRNNSTVSYLQLPTFSDNIESITLHNIANGSNGAYTGTVYFRSEANNSADPIASATCNVAAREDFVLTIPSGYKTGYIMSDSACRFFAVTVKFVGEAYTAPTLSVTDESLEIDKNGGDASTTFTLSNPIAGDAAVAAIVETGASWLTANISGNTLTVSAEKNTAANRSAKVTLRATGASKEITVSQASAALQTSTLTFTAACEGSGTADDGVEWTVTSDGEESAFDGTKGIHYGTGKKAVQYITLTTSDISGTVTKVVVNASTASGVSATTSVTVGGAAFGGAAQSLSTTANDYEFVGSASGAIVVTVTKPSSATGALYVKSVAVTYQP